MVRLSRAVPAAPKGAAVPLPVTLATGQGADLPLAGLPWPNDPLDARRARAAPHEGRA